LNITRFVSRLTPKELKQTSNDPTRLKLSRIFLNIGKLIDFMYKNVISAVFTERINRFIGSVKVDGIVETVHIKNTGRCKELLLPDSTVYLSKSDNPKRKTKYDLIAVEKKLTNGKVLLINMDSQAPNVAVGKWLNEGNLFGKDTKIRAEVQKGNSRFDFYAENGCRRAFIEVKGVTLENDGIAMFPDAPTERGVKHIKELAECVKEGYEAYIIFVIQMKGISLFMPNTNMHKEFAEALETANECGVKILAFDCIITPDTMAIDKPIPVSIAAITEISSTKL